MSYNILVLDDEKEIADLIELYLKSENYSVYKFYDSESALKCIEKINLDMAILDVMLPDIDGFSICKKIRKKYNFPVIMLTAKVDDISKDDKDIIEFLGLSMNKKNHKCILYNEELNLTPIEFSILWYLCNNRGRVVSSEELFSNVWGENYLDCNNTVMVHIKRLREKMHEKPKNPKFIKTVWGVGYEIERE